MLSFVHECLRVKLLCNFRFFEDTVTLTDCLTTLQSKIDDEKVNYVNVNRRRLLERAIACVERKKFEEAGRISVKFSDDIGQSEGAIDAGGPSREFFGLALEGVLKSSIFVGDDTEKFITKCDSGNLLYTRFIFKLTYVKN